VPLKFLLTYTTARSTAEPAEKLLALAGRSPEEASTLYMCTTVLAATALHQAIDCSLSQEGQLLATSSGVAYGDTPHAKMMGASFRTKMIRLPELLSGGEFKLNVQSTLVEDLHRLIDRRNKLLHIVEETLTFTEGSPEMEVVDGKAVIRVSFRHIPEREVSEEEARRYTTAIDLYLRKVALAEGELEPGELLVPM